MNYMMAILPKMGGFLLLVLIGFTASRTGIIKKECVRITNDANDRG